MAVGQEPRLGRWNRIAKAKNRVGIIRLDGVDIEEAENDEDIVGEEYNEPPGVESYSEDEEED